MIPTRSAIFCPILSRFKAPLSANNPAGRVGCADSPRLLVAELLCDHFPQFQPQPIGHLLGQVVVGAPAKKHDVRHVRQCDAARSTNAMEEACLARTDNFTHRRVLETEREFVATVASRRCGGGTGASRKCVRVVANFSIRRVAIGWKKSPENLRVTSPRNFHSVF